MYVNIHSDLNNLDHLSIMVAGNQNVVQWSEWVCGENIKNPTKIKIMPS